MPYGASMLSFLSPIELQLHESKNKAHGKFWDTSDSLVSNWQIGGEASAAMLIRLCLCKITAVVWVFTHTKSSPGWPCWALSEMSAPWGTGGGM